MNEQTIKNAIMSILFVSGDAVDVSVIAAALDIENDALLPIIDRMIEEAQDREAGIQLTKVDDKIQLCSNPNYMPYIDKALAPIKKSRLSQSMLETLCIIAYKQPITRVEIEQIRGVRCNYSIATLIEKGMIKRAGRKMTLGNPMLYTTSDEFLRHFGITSLNELPDLKQAE